MTLRYIIPCWYRLSIRVLNLTVYVNFITSPGHTQWQTGFKCHDETFIHTMSTNMAESLAYIYIYMDDWLVQVQFPLIMLL